MTEHPKKPFTLHADPNKAPIRDKENVHPEHRMKLGQSAPRPNLAPAGAVGTKRNLPSPQPAQISAKRFALGKPNQAAKDFKFVARQTPAKALNKTHDRER